MLCVLYGVDAGVALDEGECFQSDCVLGTFALAMAFAGNDLVNFVGVPLAGWASYTDFMANGNDDATGFPDGLNGPAKTPFVSCCCPEWLWWWH